MSDKSLEIGSEYEIRALKARISALEAENSSLRDDIAELEREMAYVSRTKQAKRKRFDDD